MAKTDLITQEDANHVLYEFGEGGYSAGNFTTKLLDAALVADQDNLRKLSQGFPGLIAAVELVKFYGGGTELVKAIADNDEAAIERLRKETGL